MALFELLLRPSGEDMTIRWQYARSSNLCQNRHSLVRAAQQLKCCHILWLDDDMTFPPDTLERLLGHAMPIVGANYTTRALPIIPTAVKNDQRVSSDGKTGLEFIDQFGFGVVLTETKIFDKIPLPWFLFDWDAGYPDAYCSEDMYFCKKAKHAGFRIAIDHDLSNQVQHIGEMQFDHSMVDSDELDGINVRALIQKRQVA